MGWKASLVIIENETPFEFEEEQDLILSLGAGSVEYIGETTMEESIHAKDNTISIANYDGNLIICDSRLLTQEIFLESGGLGLELSVMEEKLVDNFPDSEILSVACNSTVNFHGYSLIQSEKKIRWKCITNDGKEAYGKMFEEESQLYAKATQKDGIYYWEEENEWYEEDQLMEDFTFEVAKRRLGVRIDMEEGDQLFEQVPFRQYEISLTQKRFTHEEEREERKRWKVIGLLFTLLLAYQILNKIFN